MGGWRWAWLPLAVITGAALTVRWLYSVVTVCGLPFGQRPAWPTRAGQGLWVQAPALAVVMFEGRRLGVWRSATSVSLL